ncbi:MAG: hypothetical protein E6Q97_25530 [Desulfurellales bacterium]|nr:MAG: hypothetical protein E6Q97_25530 [Desulfurellales bacterium]
MQAQRERTQAVIDNFYRDHGPCCAGCDWWRWYNSAAGECIRTVPVAGTERYAMLGISWTSYPPLESPFRDVRAVMSPLDNKLVPMLIFIDPDEFSSSQSTVAEG